MGPLRNWVTFPVYLVKNTDVHWQWGGAGGGRDPGPLPPFGHRAGSRWVWNTYFRLCTDVPALPSRRLTHILLLESPALAA